MHEASQVTDLHEVHHGKRQSPRGEAELPRAALRLAPIPVTPTKPLTPSHVKGLLWLDVLERATRLVRPVSYELNRTTYDVTWQTVEFWDWLDRSDIDPAALDEIALGHRYVAFHALRGREPGVRADALRARIERGYIHPSGLRILEIWKRHYELLGIRDPGLTRTRPLPLTQDEALGLLARADLLLDLRSMGGGAYLDLTDEGIPLRTIVDADGRDNHTLCTLRELAGSLRPEETIALLCDSELAADYLLLERCLRRLGAEVFSMSLGRVRLPGDVAGSARHGGWESYTVDRIVERYRGFSPDAFKIGVRLYFIVALGAGDKTVFSFELLERFLGKARQLLGARPQGSREAGLACLAGLVRHRGFVDPYRLASLLLSPGKREALLPLLTEVFA